MTTTPLSKTVIAIFAPTASGKTAVAEAIADLIPADVISADSMQVYRGLPILTNQPARKTALVGIWPLEHEASVAEYQRLAHEAVDRTLDAGRTPLVVGGTGLYLRAALADLEIPPAPPPGMREGWERTYDRLGPEHVHSLLAEKDPEAARAVHPNDRRRVIRALELHELGSSLVSTHNRLWSEETRKPARIFGLDVPKSTLEERIEQRTKDMFARGVEEEVAAAREGPMSLTASQIIGLREVAELPPHEAASAIALRTRQYAAYQRKWMRRIPGLRSIEANGDAEHISASILAALEG
jgi:tRNA dimethylallyltransferase